jgi:hypothetical protein
MRLAAIGRYMCDIRPLRRLARIVWAMFAVIWLPGCINAYFQAPANLVDERAYTSVYPYFAEYCAVSEFNKNKGSAVDLDSGGPGGHSVFYLNGVCRVRQAFYPEVALCPDSPDRLAGRGVGLSVNAHYKNANWVATEGREFFYHGALAPGEGVTRDSYRRTQKTAKAMGILDGIVFNQETLKDRPTGMSERDFMYEISVATDYAIDLARDRYCARVPLDRGKMETIVRYLNAMNAPYRSGQKDFHWQVLRDNCAYLAHNALAAVGVWPEWPVDRPLLVAAFSFPVPKNEFVNLMRRTNDMKIADPDTLYADDEAHDALMRQGWIVTGPGALTEARRAISPNEIYDTHVRLIFYDEPIFGHYQQRFDRILTEPRYRDLRSNLRYFSTLYSAILAERPVPEPTPDRAAFVTRYREVIAHEKLKTDAALARLSGTTG